jgi:predicted dehydrogenase
MLQVGLGRWGRDWATRMLPQVASIELVGCVDSYDEALRKTVEAGIVDAARCFGSLPDALDQLEPDAVLVTTDLPSHVPTVRAALEAGCDVLSEKPLAPSLEEARQLTELAERLGRTLMVSQNYRFFPAPRTVQRMVQQRSLGQLLHVELDFRKFYPPPPGGRGSHRSWVQPLLLDMAIHHFDLLRLVIGDEPTSVDCVTWNPRWALYDDPPEGIATIRFGDVTVSYRGSWVCPDRTTLWAGEWRMEFEDGELWWTSRGDDQSAKEDRVWQYDHAGHRRAVPLVEVPLRDRAGSLSAFAGHLRAGTVPETSARDNLGSLGLAFAAIESAAKGAPVATNLAST